MEKTLSVLIAEDEPLARETLRDAVASRPELQLCGEAENGLQAKQMIDALKPDLVLLDIQMPELTGLEVLRQIQHRPVVVLTTAYDQYALTAYELNAIDYLLKPFTRERFDAAIQRVLEAPRRLTNDFTEAAVQASQAPQVPLERILVRERGQIIPVQTRQISYLKADAKYTALVTGGKTYLIRLGISELEQRLDPSRFIRIHRSVMVNLDFVQAMKTDEQSQLQMHMDDGAVLTANREVSRQLRDQVM
ncbi:LytR/AlgR family response regulator transcription factor [Undibacterium squillarum]|uniref:DNA-binding response regulator n=1 Tax=Undibacterium squillarum TaxID=1131567 RepID=A0ABQ2XT41_9BURK|nr:LytTR family DNA-binding domain-containing protein [Undibacterium squillarum]GGX31889.1 DNA-binding response regulator [Undibacterium squillarum]